MMRTVVGAASLAAAATGAAAQLMGHSVQARWLFPDDSSVLESHVVVVSDEVELTSEKIFNDSKFSIDLGDDFVLFSFNAVAHWQDVDFNGWRFTDHFGTIPDVIGYEVHSSSAGISNADAIVVGHTADAFWASFAGVSSAGDGEWIRLAVTFVPVPGALALAAIGTLPVIRRPRRT
ncbi:MAG: hypothetical protein KIS87_10455 [Phycisphaeraceae bacterium]|nr:hypothetical protein [Phycisphaeraceae bacterium]